MQSIIFGCAWFLFNIVSAVVHAVFGVIPVLVASWYFSGQSSRR
jgi:hypothetical protein